jgi:predicted P-loop ATPase
MLEHEPSWKGRLRFNAFYNKVEMDGESLSEHSRALISSWASHNLGLSGGNVKNRDQAILVVAAKDTFDPLQNYINDLPKWDGQERLERLFPEHFGAGEDPYTKWLGRILLTTMIARALSPACICRYVVILKGPQNIGKSESVRALGGEYTTELSGNLGSRDAQIQMKGVWVVELGELNSIRKSHRDEVKRFISARHDEFTLKHQNDAVKYPRRCIFIGTGNADEVLNDPTGSTRWFPVNVAKADYLAIGRDRDQLLAEALAWYLDHTNDWWHIPADVEAILEDVRDDSREVGAYEEKLNKWLSEKIVPKDETLITTWLEIAENCLNVPESQWKSVQTHVTDSLRGMGWRRKKAKKKDGSKDTHWVWHPSDAWLKNHRPSNNPHPPASPSFTPDDDDDISLAIGMPSMLKYSER